MLTLLGWSCVELAEESADCLLSASCFAVWTPPPDCVADWVVLFLLPAADLADESLVCVTEPSSPGLMMRTEMFLFCGLSCVEVAVELAVWSFVADWSATATPGAPPCWAACWFVLLALPATDVADDPFVCATTPPSPGLPIRTDTFVFEGELWVEVADDPAVCWLPADWPAPCTNGSSAAADPAATAGRRTAPAMNARRRRLIWVVPSFVDSALPGFARPACAGVRAKELARPIDPSDDPVADAAGRRCDAPAQPGGVGQRHGGQQGHGQEEDEACAPAARRRARDERDDGVGGEGGLRCAGVGAAPPTALAHSVGARGRRSGAHPGGEVRDASWDRDRLEELRGVDGASRGHAGGRRRRAGCRAAGRGRRGARVRSRRECDRRVGGRRGGAVRHGDGRRVQPRHAGARTCPGGRIPI